MTETITSAQNPKIKQLLALQEKARLRRETGIFVVEGRRELQHCIDAGFEIDTLFICHDILSGVNSDPVDPAGACRPRRGSGRVGLALKETKIFEISQEAYQKVAYREGTEGVIAEVRARERRLEDLELKENPLVVVLESVEKPGNLGAVLRSADAAGADAVLICDPLTDLYNPNLIRASIGAVFTGPCVACSSAEAISWLKAHGIQILTAQLQDSGWYYDTDMKRGTAIVIGTEATGLTQAWRDAADAHIRIPMLGALDSLNASVSAAILLFEAVRQRECAGRVFR